MAEARFDPEFVERVVQEVLRRLLQQGHGVGTPPPAASETELRMNDKLVSLATLEGRLAGVRRLIVGPHAIVTPAAKDRLRDQGIELVRCRNTTSN